VGSEFGVGPVTFTLHPSVVAATYDNCPDTTAYTSGALEFTLDFYYGISSVSQMTTDMFHLS